MSQNPELPPQLDPELVIDDAEDDVQAHISDSRLTTGEDDPGA